MADARHADKSGAGEQTGSQGSAEHMAQRSIQIGHRLGPPKRIGTRAPYGGRVTVGLQRRYTFSYRINRRIRPETKGFGQLWGRAALRWRLNPDIALLDALDQKLRIEFAIAI